jgi:hypothetical protein
MPVVQPAPAAFVVFRAWSEILEDKRAPDGRRRLFYAEPATFSTFEEADAYRRRSEADHGWVPTAGFDAEVSIPGLRIEEGNAARRSGFRVIQGQVDEQPRSERRNGNGNGNGHGPTPPTLGPFEP